MITLLKMRPMLMLKLLHSKLWKVRIFLSVVMRGVARTFEGGLGREASELGIAKMLGQVFGLVRFDVMCKCNDLV